MIEDYTDLVDDNNVIIIAKSISIIFVFFNYRQNLREIRGPL